MYTCKTTTQKKFVTEKNFLNTLSNQVKLFCYFAPLVAIVPLT